MRTAFIATWVMALAVLDPMGTQRAFGQSERELRAAVTELEALKPGGTYRIRENATFFACSDKSKLMFVERMNSGDAADQETARFIANRDCDFPNENGRYTRCGLSGFYWPKDGSRHTFSGYCRIGSTDAKPLFIRDSVMAPTLPVKTPQDCAAFAERVRASIGGKLSRHDDTSWTFEFVGPLDKKGAFLGNFVAVECEAHAHPASNAVGFHWQVDDSPSEEFIDAALKGGEAAMWVSRQELAKHVRQCMSRAKKSEKEEDVRAQKVVTTCRVMGGKDGSATIYFEGYN